MTSGKNAVSIRVAPKQADKLDRLAEKLGMTRSRLAATVVQRSIPETELFDKAGLYRLGMWFEGIMEKIHKTQPKEEGENITVGIWLNNETVASLDRIAEKLGLTRSTLARNIVVANLPEVGFFSTPGLAKIIFWLEGLGKEEE